VKTLSHETEKGMFLWKVPLDIICVNKVGVEDLPQSWSICVS
jgi:hypothetical protein